MTEDRILTVYRAELQNARIHGEPENWRMSVSKEDLRALLAAYSIMRAAGWPEVTLEVAPEPFCGGEVTSLGGEP